MHTLQNRTLETLRTSRAFVDSNADVLPTVVSSGLVQKLDTLIPVLTGLGDGQEVHGLTARGATQKIRALRKILLRDHMSPVAGVAFAELPHTPELADLRMPRGDQSSAKVAIAGRAMGKAAEPFSSVFLAAGLPQDFVAQLTAAADAVTAAADGRRQSMAGRTGATTGLRDTLVQARKTLRALDRMVVSALHDDPTRLATWKSLLHVQRAPRAKPVTTPPVVPAVVQVVPAPVVKSATPVPTPLASSATASAGTDALAAAVTS